MTPHSEINIEIERIRKDFPILDRETKPGTKLIYFDSAATSQKPLAVIEAMNDYYRSYNANIHRGVHTLAEEATARYEESRGKVARFIGAKKASELVFTRNTTESINLVAYSWGRSKLKKGDLVILTEMEHHSNLVPWQMLASEIGIRLEFIPVTDNGLLDLSGFDSLLEQKPKLVSFMHVSNVLGTINPVKEITQKAHSAGALVLVDGAQSVPHIPVLVTDLGVDFYAFSGHKMLGPTGIGGLWAKEEILKEMPPFLGGGDMIKRVYLRSFTANEIPHKFEAGTAQIAEAIGLGAAVDYLSSIGMEKIEKIEREVTAYAYEQMKQISGIRILGPDITEKGGVLSFVLGNIHPHDVAQILDDDGIAVRAGHHCAMPLHDRYNIPATTRASFYIYNTKQEVDQLILSLDRVKKVFGE